MGIRIALPKGRLLTDTSALLARANWKLDEYNGNGRLYSLRSEKFPFLQGKVLHEKDIPIQVAVGNYDLGICGLDWIEELLAKYPSSGLVKVKSLGYGKSALYAMKTSQGKVKSGLVRIASEYPNLAECFALKSRLSRFSIFPVWGGAEAYPPENAEMVLISDAAHSPDLVKVSKVLESNAYIIANRNSWESKDLLEVVDTIVENVRITEQEASIELNTISRPPAERRITEGFIRLALPDGHQQKPTVELLNKAGIQLQDYPSATGNRRPGINLEGFTVKVIRPQDMPLQVANGNFDLAITGRDWLREHVYQFPSSPVKELLDLGFGKVRIVAVVSQNLPATDSSSLRGFNAARLLPLRIASEYVNIADKYARDNHLGPYRVIPTWGATEAFLPEDADLLIENTQTGATIARHNLRIIDTLFESTACLIGSASYGSGKSTLVQKFIEIVRAALENAS